MKKNSRVNSQALVENRMALINTKKNLKKDSMQRRTQENEDWDIKCQITKIMDLNQLKQRATLNKSSLKVDVQHNTVLD